MNPFRKLLSKLGGRRDRPTQTPTPQSDHLAPPEPSDGLQDPLQDTIRLGELASGFGGVASTVSGVERTGWKAPQRGRSRGIEGGPVIGRGRGMLGEKVRPPQDPIEELLDDSTEDQGVSPYLEIAHGKDEYKEASTSSPYLQVADERESYKETSSDSPYLAISGGDEGDEQTVTPEKKYLSVEQEDEDQTESPEKKYLSVEQDEDPPPIVEQEAPPEVQPEVPDLRNGSKISTWSTPSVGSKGLLGLEMGRVYEGEQTASSMADQVGGLAKFTLGKDVVGTHYASGSDEFGATVKDGLLTHGDKVINSSDRSVGGTTTEGTRRYFSKDRDERLNFAMDLDGGLYTSDPLSEMHRFGNDQTGTVLRHNHSSLVGGGSVAGAGQLKVRDGKVEELGDDSGHYKPSLPHTAQAFEHLTGSGVMDESRSTVRVSDKGIGNTSGEILMSGLEMSAWSGRFAEARKSFQETGLSSDLARPEREIRKLHSNQRSMHQELKNLQSGREETDTNIKPSQMKELHANSLRARQEKREKARLETKERRERERKERREQRKLKDK